MTHTPQTSTPSEIVRGATAIWTRDEPDYPPGTWTLAIEIVNATIRLTKAATNEGDDLHTFKLRPADTDTLTTAGTYSYRITAGDGTDIHPLESGELEVKPSFAAAVDARTQNRRIFDALQATIEGRADATQSSYTVDGVSITKLDHEQLINARDRYAQLVAKERARSDSRRRKGSMVVRGRFNT